MKNKSLHLYAIVVAVATFFLIVAGGLVTSTGSGLAVPDWPLSFGQFFPKMEGGVFYEHGHRLIASTVGVMTVVLALWIWQKETRHELHLLAAGAVVLVCLQGLLGGLTVLLKLPPSISIAHATLGQIFFSVNVCLAVLTGLQARLPLLPKITPTAKKLQRLAVMTTGFVFLQLIAGAILRHSGWGLPLHLTGAALVTIHILLSAKRVFKEYPDMPELYQPALFLSWLLGLQIILGFLSWRMGGVVVTTAHVGVGALLLAGSVILSIQSFRRLHQLPSPLASPSLLNSKEGTVPCSGTGEG